MTKKKIAILTQPLKSNYGGIIQNYALQTVLKNQGHEVITVDRDYKSHPVLKVKINYYKRKLSSFFRNEKKFVFSADDLLYITRNSKLFIDTFINRTPKIRSSHQLARHFSDHHYDAIIVGSDQVWRPKYSPDIFNYFLDFLAIDDYPLKKIAYAASFGSDRWEFSKEQTDVCRQLAQRFDLITVREKTGVNLVKEYLESNADFVIDPTLFLSKDTYIQLFKNRVTESNRGMYTYVLDRTSDKNRIIDSAKDILKLESYYCQPRQSLTNPVSNLLEDYTYPKMEQWLKGFYDADFVVTDSFHGTVFSIIFNKPFIALVNETRGASRFESLLSELELMDRLVYTYPENLKEIIEKPIDYPKVNRLVATLKSQSLKLLTEHIR